MKVKDIIKESEYTKSDWAKTGSGNVRQHKELGHWQAKVPLGTWKGKFKTRDEAEAHIKTHGDETFPLSALDTK